MNKSVFLDRDGVIIEETKFIISTDKVQLIDKAAEAIKELNKHFKVFIVTNQPAVGKGMCSEKEAINLNNYIISQLEEKGAKIDKTFMCFHHPVHGLGKYKVECECRKPKPGMILEAAKEFDIDLENSWMIGDKIGDIKSGVLAGTKTILVKTGYGGKDGFNDAIPNYVSEDLYAASKLILNEVTK
ncbi:MAG: HAD family hydrolase [Nanoarchaeota archaeon]|nr:HAD family hydrolase [Nanoarchaeota archaeon]